MESLKYEVVVSGFGLVEAPRVDEQGNLYFTDISGGGVHRCAPGGKPETIVANERKGVGGMAFTEDGGLIISGSDVSYLDLATRKVSRIFKDYPGKLTHVFNDLTVDSQGSVLVGSTNVRPVMGPNGLNETDPGDLYRIDPDGKVTLVWEGGLELSNGMGFSPDGKTLYHVDAFAKVIFAYDVASDRRLTARRVFAALKRDGDGPTGWRSMRKAEYGRQRCSAGCSFASAVTARSIASTRRRAKNRSRWFSADATCATFTSRAPRAADSRARSTRRAPTCRDCRSPRRRFRARRDPQRRLEQPVRFNFSCHSGRSERRGAINGSDSFLRCRPRQIASR